MQSASPRSQTEILAASSHASAARLAAHPNGLPDARHIAVAQETGYTAHEVLSRGIAFCRANPREATPDFDFDQDADRRFDEAIAECWDAVDAAAAEERLASDPFRVLDAEGLTRRLTDAQAEAARVVDGRPLALSVRLEERPDGFMVYARVNGRELFSTPPLPEAEATALEPHLRGALFAYAAELGRAA